MLAIKRSEWDEFYNEQTRDMVPHDHYCDGYQDAMDRVDDWLDELPGPWVPVESDKKPEHGREYFIRYTFGNSELHFHSAAKYNATDGNGYVDRPHFTNEGWKGMRVTHWMEIPAAQKMEEKP